MNKQISDYDRRQYALMVEKLDEFRKDNIPLGRLISDLNALLSVLENPDGNWKIMFRKQWSILERINAVAAFRANNVISPESSNRIAEAVKIMEDIIDDRLKY